MLRPAVLGEFLRLFGEVMICTFGFGLGKVQLLCEGVDFELRYLEFHDKPNFK